MGRTVLGLTLSAATSFAWVVIAAGLMEIMTADRVTQGPNFYLGVLGAILLLASSFLNLAHFCMKLVHRCNQVQEA
jgi:uncharacterized membrane protein